MHPHQLIKAQHLAHEIVTFNLYAHLFSLYTVSVQYYLPNITQSKNFKQFNTKHVGFFNNPRQRFYVH